MTTPEQRGALVHREGRVRTAVVHQYPETPWNDEVEYRFSLKHMVGFLYNRIFGQKDGEVAVRPEARSSGKTNWFPAPEAAAQEMKVTE